MVKTLDEYEALIPEAERGVIARLDTIERRIMTSSINDKFLADTEIRSLLQEATALYGYFVTRYYKWDAVLDNQEVEAYIEQKRDAEAQGVKFVSAPADREAANKVRDVLYVRNTYEGQLKRCEQYVNTCKKLLETNQRERQQGAGS